MRDHETSNLHPSPRISRDSVIASGLAAATFLIYALGATRTIYVGDSGELVAAAWGLGIPHPTGYPLYVILGKVWTLMVPIGTIAFRMSLFSAACAAGAVALVYRIGRRLDVSVQGAMASSLILAFVPSFWGEANIQRVYPLNALFVALVILQQIRWTRTKRLPDLAVAFLLCGIGATNHTIMAVVAIALALSVLIARTRFALEGKTILTCGGATAVGLLPYLYLPLRSRANPFLDSGDPETLERFLDVVLRRDFLHRTWYEGAGDLFIIAIDFVRALGSETLWLGLVFAVAGGWAVLSPTKERTTGKRKKGKSPDWLSSRRFFLLFGSLAGAANVLALALHGSREDLFIWHRYYIPSFVILVILAGIGLDRLTTKAPRWAWAALILPAMLLSTGYLRFDRSHYRIADDYSRTLLESLPPDSTLVAVDDNISFSLVYLHEVEGVRPDVRLILQGVAQSAPSGLNVSPAGGSVLFTHPPGEVPGVRFVPVGLAFQSTSDEGDLPPILVDKRSLEGEDDDSVPKDYLTSNLIGDFHLMIGTALSREDWPAARREFDRATAAAPDHLALHYNLGMTYVENGLFDEAIDEFNSAERIAPRGFPRADGTRVRPIDRVREIEPERERIRAIEEELQSDERLSGVRRESPEFHRALATLLLERGERLAARGRILRAEELEDRE